MNLHLLEVHAADQPEMTVLMAGVADRFLGPQSPGIVCPDEPVLIPGPDQPDAHILQIPMVLFSRRGQAAVMIHPYAPVFQVEGQVELLFLLLERQQPAEFRPCEISSIPGAFTGGVRPEAVRPAQIEMFRGIQVGEGVLAPGGQQQVRPAVQVLPPLDVAGGLVVGAVGPAGCRPATGCRYRENRKHHW